MTFTPMGELLSRALAGGYAVPSFECWNAEAILTVLRVARKMDAPVILMNSQIGFPLLGGPCGFSQIAHAVADDHRLPVALHLDHGGSLDLVRECLKARFSSVMLDFSRRSYEENAAAMRQVVAWAHPLDVTVEGEIGAVGRADNITVEGGRESTLTDPAEAGRFARETGVDCLAVSIGNAHGQYVHLPQLDFDRLAKIRQAARIPLVLHGGSGTPQDDLRRAIGLGMAKVNVATDCVRAWWSALEAQKEAGRNLWLPVALEDAMQNVARQVERWLIMTGAAGRARR